VGVKTKQYKLQFVTVVDLCGTFFAENNRLFELFTGFATGIARSIMLVYIYYVNMLLQKIINFSTSKFIYIVM
jgi:hypothetical protein